MQLAVSTSRPASHSSAGTNTGWRGGVSVSRPTTNVPSARTTSPSGLPSGSPSRSGTRRSHRSPVRARPPPGFRGSSTSTTRRDRSERQYSSPPANARSLMSSTSSSRHAASAWRRSPSAANRSPAMEKESTATPAASAPQWSELDQQRRILLVGDEETPVAQDQQPFAG